MCVYASSLYQHHVQDQRDVDNGATLTLSLIGDKHDPKDLNIQDENILYATIFTARNLVHVLCKNTKKL